MDAPNVEAYLCDACVAKKGDRIETLDHAGPWEPRPVEDVPMRKGEQPW